MKLSSVSHLHRKKISDIQLKYSDLCFVNMRRNNVITAAKRTSTNSPMFHYSCRYKGFTLCQDKNYLVIGWRNNKAKQIHCILFFLYNAELQALKTKLYFSIYQFTTQKQKPLPKGLCEFLGANRFVAVLKFIKNPLQRQGNALRRVVTFCGHHVHRLRRQGPHQSYDLKNLLTVAVFTI